MGKVDESALQTESKGELIALMLIVCRWRFCALSDSIRKYWCGYEKMDGQVSIASWLEVS